MLRLISNLFASVRDKIFAAALAAATAGIAIVLYFLWDNIVQPQIDLYFMTKLNAYISGDLEKGLPRTAKIENLAKKEIVALRASLFDDIDAVYPISVQYTKDQIKSLGTNPPRTQIYFYADPEKHGVRVVIYLRQVPFQLDYCINNNTKEGCRRGVIASVDEDITPKLKRFPLTPTRGGEEHEFLKYPKYIQLLQIDLKKPHWDAVPENTAASIDGYIMVKRAREK